MYHTKSLYTSLLTLHIQTSFKPVSVRSSKAFISSWQILFSLIIVFKSHFLTLIQESFWPLRQKEDIPSVTNFLESCKRCHLDCKIYLLRNISNQKNLKLGDQVASYPCSLLNNNKVSFIKSFDIPIWYIGIHILETDWHCTKSSIQTLGWSIPSYEALILLH